ncbi:PREDICTED: bromodomain-containing protein DDB_G0270170-like [Ceratosolen solmsi marchali]|uniref:Bromodomain-containing protein DDB_G0270170-like n=1 Tax=Ceratosolen solmsi marchali TaxID=326594 RepID=A0AAJ6YF23_9HYME|nr:PREDICTED: bromodomain-containing protein DDB_G0270170-like [Ceratosolen solmsi marchali]
MGATFSNGQDNDELVDNLVDSGYIRSKKIEQVFRAVDRGDYFLSSHRDNAYKDFAWKHGNIHLSAPCIYCEIMEELALKPGLSFLNLGSGTGYLNTMAGLLLSQSGTNHGIELHEDCVRYSYDRLDEFKQKSLALDEFDFCEPIFIQGNCLSIVPGRQYDRVYCGATCPETHEILVKQFVKVGGILIMPYKDNLVKAKKINETTWEHETILPVSFANLIIPSSSELINHLPECDPLSLQELCRGKIRHRLRHNVWFEHTDLETHKPILSERHQPSSPHRALHQFVIPIYEESDDNTLNEDEVARVHRTQLLLNVDGPPGEDLRTTLQIVRAVNQPNRNGEPNATENSYQDINWMNDEDESPSVEDDTQFDTNPNSERQDSESSSDSACEKSQSESHSQKNNSDFHGNRGLTTNISAYSNMSESESDQDVDNEHNAYVTCRSTLQQQSSFMHRKNGSRKEKADSGILDDVSNAGNDEESLSSDSDFANGTPVKHKRSNSTNENRSSMYNNNNNSNRANESNFKRNPLRNLNPSDNPYTGHYVDTNAFSSYMKEKIHQLPLPYSLKLYINYNRNL